MPACRLANPSPAARSNPFRRRLAMKHQHLQTPTVPFFVMRAAPEAGAVYPGTKNNLNDLSEALHSRGKETPMLKKLALATATVALLMSSASADYYIVQEKATKKCKVVETRPTETTWIQIGPAAFKTQDEAERQVKTVCVEK